MVTMTFVESTVTVFVDVGESLPEDNVTANVDSQDVKREINNEERLPTQSIAEVDIKTSGPSLNLSTLSVEDKAYWTKWLLQNERGGEGEGEDEYVKLLEGMVKEEKPMRGPGKARSKYLAKNGEDLVVQRNEYEMEIALSFPEHKEKPNARDVAKSDDERSKDLEAKVQKQIGSKGRGILHTLTCKICKKKCFTRGSTGASGRFKSHVEAHFQIPSPCPYCQAVFTLTRFLQMHKEKMHFKDNSAEQKIRKSFGECAKTTKLKRGGRKGFSDHEEKVSLEQIFKETFDRKKEIDTKVKQLTIKEGNKMSCGVCKYQFDRTGLNVSQRFKSHVEGHLDIKHPCPYCALICTRSNNLRLHKKKSHLNDYKLEKNFIQLKKIETLAGTGDIFCQICDNKFVTKNSLQMHVTKQHHEKEDTDRAEAQKIVSLGEVKALINAQLERKGEKEDGIYSCRMCSFSQPKTIGNTIMKVRQHIETHLKVKVSCTNCGNSFKSIRLMKVHRKNDHLVENDAKVGAITELDAEKRVQEQFQKTTQANGETFKCNTCEYKTINKSCSARREMKVHVEKHLNVHINCPFCEKEFVSCRVLKIHKRREHASKYENEKMVQSMEVKKGKLDLPKAGQRKGDKPDSSNIKNMESRATSLVDTLTNEEISEKIEANMTVDKDNTGKRRYVCKICWESGHQRTPMLIHVELHLGIQLPCPHCHSIEQTRSNLKLHLFNAHNK